MSEPTDDLRTRIAALVTDELIRQAGQRDGYWFKYTPLDDEGNDLPELIGLDTSIDPAVVADAVIAELELRQEVDDKTSFRMEPPCHRYVTDWIADE